MKHNFYLLLFIGWFAISCGGNSSNEGENYFNSGQYEKAIEVYTEHLQTHPRHVQSLYNRGRSFEELGKIDEAVADYTAILEFEPNNASALSSLAKVYLEQKDHENALYYADLAVKNSNGNARVYYLRARAYHNQGKFNEAMADYDNAITINRNMGHAFLYRGALKIRMKRWTSGCSDLRIAKSLNVAEADNALQKYCK